nr:hypothetical protein CFP56_69419 [Quercus suber]
MADATTPSLSSTRSLLHLHTTTSPWKPLPCPHLLMHTVTDRSSANPCCPDLRNVVLHAPLHRSSPPTFFSIFSPIRRVEGFVMLGCVNGLVFFFSILPNSTIDTITVCC